MVNVLRHIEIPMGSSDYCYCEILLFMVLYLATLFTSYDYYVGASIKKPAVGVRVCIVPNRIDGNGTSGIVGETITSL